MNKKDLLLKKKKLLAMLSLSVSMTLAGCEDMRLVEEATEEIDFNDKYDFVVVFGNGNAVIYKYENENPLGFNDFSDNSSESIEYDKDLVLKIFGNCMEFNTLEEAKEFADAIISPEGKVTCMFDEEELNNQQKQNKR